LKENTKQNWKNLEVIVVNKEYYKVDKVIKIAIPYKQMCLYILVSQLLLRLVSFH